MIQAPNQANLELLRAAVEQAFNAVLVTDAKLLDGGPLIEFCNPAFCRMTGYEASDLIGRSPRILQGPATDRAVLDELHSCLLEGRFFQGATVNYRKDGTPYHVEWNISPVSDDRGVITHFVSVQQNITARIEAERMRDLLAAALNASTDPVLITDDQARACFVNRSFESVTGYSGQDLLGQTPKILQSGEHSADFYADLMKNLGQGHPFRAVFRNKRKDGSHYFADQSITPIRDSSGEIRHYLSISRDITEAVEHSHELRELARRDALTGLLNRGAGDGLLSRRVEAAAGGAVQSSLLLGDIDHFKRINDQFGHARGDRVLKAVASMLQDCVRNADSAIRWGGEEFLIILDDATSIGAVKLARRIRKNLARWQDPEIGSVTMSWGVVSWRFGESAEQVLDRADTLLYTAKANGRNRIESDQSTT